MSTHISSRNPLAVTFFITLIVSLVITGCSSGGNGSSSENTGETTITPQGGVARSADGKVTLNIPANALATEQTITIKPVDAADLGPEFEGMDIAFAYEMGPSGLQFSEPVEVSVSVNGKPVVDTDTIAINDLQLLLTSDGNQIELLGNPTMLANADNNSLTVSGNLNHFSPLVGVRFLGPDTGSMVTVAGVPTQLNQGEQKTAHVTVDPSSISFGTVPFYDDPHSGEPFYSSSTLGILELDQGSPPYFIDFHYSCIFSGKEVYDALVSAKIKHDEPKYAALTHKEVAWSFRKTVTCVDPNSGGGSGNVALTTGVRSSPPGLAALEAAWVGYTTILGLQNQLVAILSGANGYAMINLEDHSVLSNKTGAQDPLLGVNLLTPLANALDALFAYGQAMFGGNLTRYDENGQPLSFAQLIQGEWYDSTGSDLDDAVAAGSRGLLTFSADPTYGDLSGDLVNTSSADFNYLSPVSAVRSGDNALVITSDLSGGTGSGALYQVNVTTGVTSKVADLDGGPRKLRCDSAQQCSVTQYASDSLRMITWDKVSTATLGATIAIDDGPVEQDMLRLGINLRLGDGMVAIDQPTLIGSAGFLGDTITLTAVDSTGTQQGQWSQPAPDGCSGIGHLYFLPVLNSEKLPYVLATCYNSSTYAIGEVVNQETNPDLAAKLSIRFQG